MKYAELLAKTAERKREAIAELDEVLRGSCGFLLFEEIKEKGPGSIAWAWLAKEFVETLAEHISEFIAEGDDVASEVQAIYTAYEEKDSGIYYLLPVEAQLFEREA